MKSLRFIYLRDTQRQPVACVATILERKQAKIAYAISVLNPQDCFNRSTARDLAVGRLVQNGSTLDLGNVKVINCHVITRMIMKDLLTWDKEHLPSRARKAARRWLNDNQEYETAERSEKVVSLFGGGRKQIVPTTTTEV